MSSNSVDSGHQDAAPLDSNSHNREPHIRAIPIRTIVGRASVGRGSDSARDSVGISNPVLARVQHVNSANLNGIRGSQVSGYHHGPDGNTRQRMADSETQ